MITEGYICRLRSLPVGKDQWARENIKNLTPYSSARHEFTGKASVFLDANENAYGSPGSSPSGEAGVRYNRYPDPLQWQLKFQLARIKGVPAENIFIVLATNDIDVYPQVVMDELLLLVESGMANKKINKD